MSKRKPPKNSTIKEFLKSAGVVIGASILVRSTVVQAYHVTSGSMENTILTGDFVIADKLTYGTQIPDRLPFFETKVPSFRMPGFRDPAPGDLVIIESMKTEQIVKSPRDGTVERVSVQEGDRVDRGMRLVVLVPLEEE